MKRIFINRLVFVLLALLLCCSCSGDGVSSVSVRPKTKMLTLGLTVNAVTQLSAEIRPSDADFSLVWSSSDTSVATVSQLGSVTALSPGIARITAKDTVSGKSSVCVLRVSTLPQGLTIRADSITLKTGATFALSPKLYPVQYVPMNYRTITWSSSDSSVATVDSQGIVKAVAHGKAVITAVTVNDISALCEVTVGG